LNAEDANKTSLCFIRDIENIDINDKSSDRFIDVKIDKNGNKVLDTEAQDLLNHLKNVKIPEKLSKSNIFQFKVKNKIPFIIIK
jgi:hypothetical protein